MILDKIVNSVQKRLTQRKAILPLEELKAQLTDPHQGGRFIQAMAEPGISFIAEIKKASPSAGIICPDFDPCTIAKAYSQSKARAISVLTEEDHFQGSLQCLKAVRPLTTLPIIQKDFIIAPYQIYEARLFQTDCILLIAAILDQTQMENLLATAEKIGIDVLMEIHNQEDLDKIKGMELKLIGINNRDLTTFKTDLQTTIRLREKLAHHCRVISESAIKTRQDVAMLESAGIDGILVGETVMRSPDMIAKIDEMLGK